MLDWLLSTLRDNVEIPLFLSLLVGFSVGRIAIAGVSLGEVTATLLAALAIGQIGVEVSDDLKSVFFAFYLFAVGYAAGPQFVRGLFSGGLNQAVYAALISVIALAAVYVTARVAGYHAGEAAGLYAGTTTTSAALPLSETAVRQSGLTAAAAAQAESILPVAFSISYLIGTFGGVLVLGILGPKLMGVDLAAACRAFGKSQGGSGSGGEAWHHYLARVYLVEPGSVLEGRTAAEVEHYFARHRLYLPRLRRDGAIVEATSDTILEAGDAVVISGTRRALLEDVGHLLPETDDPDLLDAPLEGTDILVTSRHLNRRTLREIGDMPETRGLFLTGIRRGAMSVEIPILPETQLFRGDVVTVTGRPADIARAARTFGYPDRETERADIAFIGAAVALGALVGALTLKVGEVPLTLSTAGGVLLTGLLLGWLRSVRPIFGRVPAATTWFMNTMGLNMFIAAVGLDAAPGVLSGLQALGFTFVGWSLVATVIPLLACLYLGRWLFRFDDALLFGCAAGARTAPAALSMITDKAESQAPALGYSVAYATASTIQTLFGIVIVLLF